MDPTTAAGFIGGGAALLGALVGGSTAVVQERIRSSSDRRRAHESQLRSACADFMADIARIRSNSYRLSVDPAAENAILTSLEEARVNCERLRILLSNKVSQEAARLALRHVYAVWQLEATGTDPRAAKYPGKPPSKRLREELTRLYIGVRTELGVSNPQDVFVDLDD